MTSAIIGTPDPNLASDLEGILDEQGEFEVRAVLDDSETLVDRVRRMNPDIVFIDEQLGPQPSNVVVAEISRRFPATSVLLISATRTPQRTIQAMEAGARGLIGHPFAYEDVASHVDAAIGWSDSMRSVLEGATLTTGRRGRVAAVVGAKGGVGTTTMATHLGLSHLMEHPEAKVCLIDADVEKGDVSALLEVRQAVSIANVARVSDDMTAQTVRDALVHHETGLHLLLAPVDVRESEFVTSEALRDIVELLRREFDLVIIDGGGHVSPTQAAAVEAADVTLVVTTADVLAVRAMRKRMQGWEALGVVDEASCLVLVNQVDRASLFPSSAVERLTTARVLSTTIPLSPRVLEQALNDRDPRSVTEAGWWRLLREVRNEISPVDAPRDGVPPTRSGTSGSEEPPKKSRWSRLRGDSTASKTPEQRTATPAGGQGDDSTKAPATAGERGAVAVENAAMIPLAILLALVCWQAAVIGLTFLYSGHAASAASREFAISGSRTHATEMARDAVPGPFADGIHVATNGREVRVRMNVPGADIPGLPESLTTTRKVVTEP